MTIEKLSQEQEGSNYDPHRPLMAQVMDVIGFPILSPTEQAERNMVVPEIDLQEAAELKY